MNEHINRRAFLAALGLATAGTLTPPVLGQQTTQTGAETHRFSIAGTEIELWLTLVNDSTLRISITPSGSRLQPATAFTKMGLEDRTWPPAKAHLHEADSPTTVIWGKRRIVISASPLTLRLLDESSKEMQRLVFDATTGRVSFNLHDLPVFGLGEGGHQLDRRGVIDQMRNGQFKPDQLLNGGRSPIPWLISPAGWALFFHHPMGTFDLTGKDGIFRPAEPPSSQDIFLIVAKEPAVLLREFASLTGRPHLPPLWALGYQQSHRTLTSREEVLQEAKTFREKKLPCDVLIYLGTGFAPSGWNTAHGSFAFNSRIFPDPQAMFHEMHDEGFRVVLHVLGVPHDLHGNVTDTSPDPDSAANYWSNHVNVFRTGIDGWWVDDGDELFPEARLTRNRMYWEGPLLERPNVRPFSIQRNGYAGIQRYGWMWSGDVNSSWATLRAQIADGLNTGLSGIPYWGTDTGGFFTTKELTAELYVRWFQFSAFCPLFRSHGRTWKLRLPWGWDEGNVGPVEDNPDVLPAADQLHNPEVEIICRKYLDLRYQLLPYLYSTVYETHNTGMPIMRALWLAFPDDTKALTIADAYMWGKAILVAPVATSALKERKIYLPHGIWHDFWTEDVVVGGAEISKPVDLATLPLYLKAGALLPLGPVKQFALEPNIEPLTLVIYPGDDGEFNLYEDDGCTFDYEHGASSRIQLAWKDRERKLYIALHAGDVMHRFSTQHFKVRMSGSQTTRFVSFAGKPVIVSL